MNTIFLVHGFADTARRMNYMAKYLTRRGCKVLVPNLQPSNGKVTINELAEQLENFITSNTLAAERIDIIGYSMGGLIARYYLQRLGGLLKTDRFIAVSTPHHGTITAHLFRGPGIRQMRPGSLFLKDLNKDTAALSQISCTSLFTPLDLTIIPARSSVVDFAPSVSFLVPIHFLMVYNRRVLKAITQILSTPLKVKSVINEAHATSG